MPEGEGPGGETQEGDPSVPDAPGARAAAAPRPRWGPEVVALVGGSGTGKSHHAAETADRLEADALIDDGLLIADGEILAGRSAKREGTSLAAVRRAIFSNARDARHVQEAIEKLGPRRILVLGTSEHMVSLIAERLALPSPSRFVSIEEIVSGDNIAIARRTRREEGKHVIPAPTLQVKKTFPGYLVDPLRLLFGSSVRGHHVVEKSIVRPSYSTLGRISIASRAVAQVAHEAALRAEPGRVTVLHTHVLVRQEGVDLALEIRLLGGREPLWDRLARLQLRVVDEVEEWTALSVETCHVTLRDLATRRRRPPGGRPAGEKTARDPESRRLKAREAPREPSLRRTRPPEGDSPHVPLQNG